MRNKMITSIPISAVELGIDFEGYEKLAQNIGRMKSLAKWQRQRILERADKELPEKIPKIRKLLYDLADDRQVYRIAEIPYWKGPPKGEKLFITSITDYLLRNR